MSDISVTVTNAGASAVAVSGGSTISPTIGNGGSVSVAIGSVIGSSPTVVSGTLTIGKVTTLAAGSQATVVNSGTAYAAIIDLGLPAGATGAAGAAGKDGTTPAFSIGAVTTGSAGTSASVKATTTDGGAKVALDFTIPRGDTGAGGGVSLSSATPAALGTAAAGSATTAARGDHVHALPTAKDLGLATVATSGAYSDLTGTPAAYTLPTASDKTLGGIKVGANLSITDGVLAATGGSNVSLSDATPQPLGTASPGDDSDAARADHIHAMPTASDVGALAVDDTVDGGDYVGVIINPGDSITITTQPASTSVESGGVNEVQSTLPAGTWGASSYANSQWFVSGNQSTQADYIAVSANNGASWTKRLGLPNAGQWSAIQYANGVYATQSGNVVAYSSDATNWSASTITYSRGSVFAAGGKFLRATQTGIYHSTDAANWTQSLTHGSRSSSLYFAYANGVFFAVDYTYGARASADGVNWDSGALSNVDANKGNQIVPAVLGGAFYFGRRAITPGVAKYESGTWSTVSVSSSLTSQSGQVASDGSKLVFYSYSNPNAESTIWTSTNGSTWVQRYTLGSWGMQRAGTLFYAGSRFVLLRSGSGNSGLEYYTSPDGIEWTQHTRQYGTPPFNNLFDYRVSDTYADQLNGVWSSITFGGLTASATFFVVAAYSSAISYQWQVSTDAGSTWTNISGETASTLVLTGLTSADSGKRYRVQLSATGASTVTSSSATLTVT